MAVKESLHGAHEMNPFFKMIGSSHPKKTRIGKQVKIVHRNSLYVARRMGID